MTKIKINTLRKRMYFTDHGVGRDPDVLDTWFSSGLWPFATLGWPDNKEYVEKFYPTSVLVTGFDIIFFWVARMIMFGTEFLNKEPFKDIYVHALVKDEKGQKMSKSKGNVIDPLDLIEKYSADALRFTLLSMVNLAKTNPKWLGFSMEGYVFAGIIFWIICYSMSKYSQKLELKFKTDR